jgi:hypothetical protein
LDSGCQSAVGDCQYLEYPQLVKSGYEVSSSGGELPFSHADSFPQAGADCYPVEFQTAPLPKSQTVGKCIMESVGGALGGDIGALMADWLEPGISSWHRGTAHSCAAGMGILSLGEVLAGAKTYCRQQAEAGIV